MALLPSSNPVSVLSRLKTVMSTPPFLRPVSVEFSSCKRPVPLKTYTLPSSSKRNEESWKCGRRECNVQPFSGFVVVYIYVSPPLESLGANRA